MSASIQSVSTPPLPPPTRIGLIGINERARRLLLKGLAASPRAAITAVCSRDLAKAQATAGALGGGVRAFGRLDDLFGSGVVDAAFVNTPVAQHAATCEAAISAGCAVICEKPLAETTEQATHLAALAQRHGVRTVVNFTYRSVPGYRFSERLLQETGIGRPLHAEFALLQGHNFFSDFAHGSALLDSGTHLFDALLGLTALAGFGRLAEVCAAPMLEPRPASGAAPLDHGWAFTGRTESGALVSATFSRSALGWRNGLRWSLYGDRAAVMVEFDAARTEVRLAHRGDGAPQGTWRHVELPADIQADDERFPEYHMDRLVAALRGEERFPGFAEAAETHRIADALAASAATSKWTAVQPP